MQTKISENKDPVGTTLSTPISSNIVNEEMSDTTGKIF